MNSLLGNRRVRIVAAAVLLSIAFAACPTPTWAQASITNYPPNVVAEFISTDGSVVSGYEYDPDTFTLSGFVLKNGVKTTLSLYGGYGFPAGMSADGSTVVGYEYDFSFSSTHMWIWHEGDAHATPLHPEISGAVWGISADGSTIIGQRPDGFDAHAFVIRNGAYSELTYPGAFSTLPFAVSANGSVIGGIVYAPDPNFNKPIVWDLAGNPTVVPLSTDFQTQVDAISSDGTTVAGRGFIWKVGDPSALSISFSPQGLYAATPDGSAVVGWTETNAPFGGGQAYVWKNGVETPLAPPTGFLYSAAYSISPDGFRIFGVAWNGDIHNSGTPLDVVVWQGNEGPRLLKDMLADAGVSVGSQRLSRPYGFSADGTIIIGEAIDGDSTQGFRAVLPLPPTPPEMIQNLINKVQGLNIHHGIQNALISKLNTALTALNGGNTAGVIAALNDFIGLVNAQKGKKIPVATANELIADAQAIIAKLTG